jgi:hypothetical protein
MKWVIAIFAVSIATSSFAADLDFDQALQNARDNCSGIASGFNRMKTLAGINTAITGVGALAGGGAVATGFIKRSKDGQIAELELAKLREIEENLDSRPNNPDSADVLKQASAYYEQHKNDTPEQIEAQVDKLTRQSKTLGNWRTGLMAGNTATNIAGAIIAGGNKAKDDLKGAIDDCKSSVAVLRSARMQARLDGADSAKLAVAERIIAECGKWDAIEVSKISNRAAGAMWSSIAGAAIGGAGTTISAIANTNKIRDDNSDFGKAKENNLNISSNVLAIGSTAASVAATVFNATQITAIKKASEVADRCEEALQ